MPKIRLRIRKRGKRGGRRGTANRKPAALAEERPKQKAVLAIDKTSFKVRNLEGQVVYEGSLKGWYKSVRVRKQKAEMEEKRHRGKRRALLSI